MYRNFDSRILDIAERALVNVVPLGNNKCIMAPGTNGPYFDIETPIRNSSHWLVTFCIMYSLTKKESFKNASLGLLNFLLEPGEYCIDNIYVHRQKKGKDWCNGVIGQAWVAEALFIAAEILSCEKAKNKALKAVNAFNFDNKVKAWRLFDPSTQKRKIDYTLNHQLWFAAAKIKAGSSAYEEVDDFLDFLKKTGLRLRNDGLICHLLYSDSWQGIQRQVRYKLLEKRNYQVVTHKEIGYHLFNLFPLARIYKHRPTHDFFKTEKFKKLLGYCLSTSFLEKLNGNKYSYCYNSPAFEFPLIIRTFSGFLDNDVDLEEVIEKQLQIQFEQTFDIDSSLFSRNTKDPLTLTSRIYEYILSFKEN